MTLQIGDVIQDKYRIVRLIGQGGMGAVYEGENTLIARRVAIKVLYSQIAGQQGVVERFEREAQAAGRIGNDHILEVLDMGTLDDGNRFMVMEYLDGETLGERTKRLGPLTADQIFPLARQLLVGLAAAHHAGIIHRDLKPDNVFISRQKAGQADFVKIIDFGISKFTQLDQDMKMTATGAVMGTPYFMSPEQAKGTGGADGRSDLYAVGVILYKTVTGRVPFDGETFNELLFKIVLSPMPQPRQLVPELDPAFETIIQKAMARDPDRRFQTAQEFIQALDAWKDAGTSVTVPPPEEIGLGAGASVIEPSRGGTQITPAETDAGPINESETKGTWSNAGGVSPKKGGSTGLRIGLVALALATIVGGAAAFVLGDDGTPGEADIAADEPAAAMSTGPNSESSDPSPEVIPVEEDAPATEPTPAVSAETLNDGAGGTTSAAAPTAAPKPKSAVRHPQPRPAPQPKPVARPAPSPQPVARPAPVPKPAPAPRPAPKPSPSKKTSSPDFGY